MNSKPAQPRYLTMSEDPTASDDSGEFLPHVTVATVIEKDGRFLMVEEQNSSGNIVINQPAGHLDPRENLVEAAVRETLEETGWHIEILGVLGINLYRSPNNGVTYHRTTFVGRPLHREDEPKLDDGIVEAVWLSLEELQASVDRHRSPLVLHCVQQYLSGNHYPVDMLSAHI